MFMHHTIYLILILTLHLCSQKDCGTSSKGRWVFTSLGDGVLFKIATPEEKSEVVSAKSIV